jgi:hypothetical protein
LDAYVLNAREAELGTGVGPKLKETLLFVRSLQAQWAQLKVSAAPQQPPAATQ